MRIATQGYMIKWEDQNWNTWPNMDINIGIYDQVYLSTLRYISKCKYQNGTHKQKRISMRQLKISTHQYITTCEYQHENTWPSKIRNTEIHDKLWISTWGYMTKIHDYQHTNTCPNLNNNMGINDLVWFATQAYMSK